MSNTHTPGPWTHTPMQDSVWANDGETKICRIEDLPWIENPVTGRRSSNFEGEQANARLIAAAPDLLRAVETLLFYIPGYNEGDFAGRPWITEALAALEKVKGGGTWAKGEQ